MSDEFKEQLIKLERGELSPEEQVEIEEELEKLEILQEHIDRTTIEQMPPQKKQQLNIKRSKWRLRFEQMATLAAVAILFTILSSIITMGYYSIGNKGHHYPEIARMTYEVTNPGLSLSGGTNATPYFQLKADYTLSKQVGRGSEIIGTMTTTHFFSLLAYPNKQMWEYPAAFFEIPGTTTISYEEWDRAEQLGSGTVINAAVSFDQFYHTEEVHGLLDEYNLDILFYGVDTGETKEMYGRIDPVGFPAWPLWLQSDRTLHNVVDKGTYKLESYSYPDVQENDEEVLQQQFIKVLEFLNTYQSQAEKYHSDFAYYTIEDRLAHIKENGIRHYGVLLTGPTEEILKLKGESWITRFEIQDVDFYNW
ncbi:anti-sigma factor [Bacillus alkalicellulosilyticus]|uniref:anti-sigma factor n=1 Tax=Alkalihalobacterium alkalicellulosilyticum TaxID=1912214 RepID=UPI001483C964|nr:anti-sigma factor [Bacillus alkalicellulosilyticus]